MNKKKVVSNIFAEIFAIGCRFAFCSFSWLLHLVCSVVCVDICNYVGLFGMVVFFVSKHALLDERYESRLLIADGMFFMTIGVGAISLVVAVLKYGMVFRVGLV